MISILIFSKAITKRNMSISIKLIAIQSNMHISHQKKTKQKRKEIYIFDILLKVQTHTTSESSEENKKVL